MARQNYSELDEEDFYGQGFEQNGVVSIWVASNDKSVESEDIDVLQDLCGVGYYNLDKQDSACQDFKLVPMGSLLLELSYASSFYDSVLKKANDYGINCARWVIAQYDFAYDPSRVKRKVEKDPVFLGVFKYSKSE